jgi:hypothetical protein
MQTFALALGLLVALGAEGSSEQAANIASIKQAASKTEINFLNCIIMPLLFVFLDIYIIYVK